MSTILSAKAFNEMQNAAYKVYAEKCLSNGITPKEQQNTCDFILSCNYGYVRFNAEMNNVTWKKNKKQLL